MVYDVIPCHFIRVQVHRCMHISFFVGNALRWELVVHVRNWCGHRSRMQEIKSYKIYTWGPNAVWKCVRALWISYLFGFVLFGLAAEAVRCGRNISPKINSFITTAKWWNIISAGVPLDSRVWYEIWAENVLSECAHSKSIFIFCFLQFVNALDVPDTLTHGLCNATKSQNNSQDPYGVYQNLFKFTCHRIFQVQIGDEYVDCGAWILRVRSFYSGSVNRLQY